MMMMNHGSLNNYSSTTTISSRTRAQDRYSNTTPSSSAEDDKLDVNFWKGLLKNSDGIEFPRREESRQRYTEDDDDDDVIIPTDQEELLRSELLKLKEKRQVSPHQSTHMHHNTSSLSDHFRRNREGSSSRSSSVNSSPDRLLSTSNAVLQQYQQSMGKVKQQIPQHKTRETSSIQNDRKREVHEIGEKLLHMNKSTGSRLSPRRTVTTTPINGSRSNSPRVTRSPMADKPVTTVSNTARKSNSLLTHPSKVSKTGTTVTTKTIRTTSEKDPSETQKLKYTIELLKTEYYNCRIREQKALQLAQLFEDLLKKQIQCNKDLKKSYCEKEIEIVKMREMVDELNGALQRANMADQSKKNNRGLAQKLAENLDSIHESIIEKKSLLSIITQQQEELNQHSKLINTLTKALQKNSKLDDEKEAKDGTRDSGKDNDNKGNDQNMEAFYHSQNIDGMDDLSDVPVSPKSPSSSHLKDYNEENYSMDYDSPPSFSNLASPISSSHQRHHNLDQSYYSSNSPLSESEHN